MKWFAIIFVSLMFLTACVETGPDLPPVPPPPGQAAYVGGAVSGIAGAMPDWAASPVGAIINPATATYGDGVIVTVSNYDYVYQNGYYFNSQRRMWEQFSLEGEPVDAWLKQSGVATLPVSEQKFVEGENYIVVYACKKVAGQWDCNDRRWMLLTVDVSAPEMKAQPLQNVEQYVIDEGIPPFDLVSTGGEMDNFEEVIVKRYDGRYRDPQSSLIVLTHVFEFDTSEELRLTESTLFKDIINQGWKRYEGQNIALFLDEYDQRVAVWTSGKKLVYVETHTPHFAAAEIIDAYLAMYPSDLQRQ